MSSPWDKLAELLIDISQDLKLIDFECLLKTLGMNSNILGVTV